VSRDWIIGTLFDLEQNPSGSSADAVEQGTSVTSKMSSDSRTTSSVGSSRLAAEQTS
jgi:hypothetical protein